MYIKREVDIKEAKKIIENGGVVYTDEGDRRIGKSTAIRAYSQWAGKPIVAKNRQMSGLHNWDNVVVVGNKGDVFGKQFKNGVLVDDIDEDDYIKLRETIIPSVPIAGFVVAKNRNGVDY